MKCNWIWWKGIFHTARNQRGQMAIFVAMIFQVLFVLFAMTINVAMVVHDKINLQNSVDFAAYYAAQKQAELLNGIAHSNYQIRQSWKVLSWRYRVLGTLGLQDPPAHPARTNDKTEGPFPNTATPSICVTYWPIWKNTPQNENLCKKPVVNIPPLPSVQNLAPFLGINSMISSLSQSLINQYNSQCERHGAYNYWFGAMALMSFRVDQAHRKMAIFGLADALSNGNPDDFLDIDGNSVYTGAFKTFEKNLTFSNKENPSRISFQIFNSLHNVPRANWLPEIQTWPTVYYTDIVKSGNACNANPVHIRNLPADGNARNFLNSTLNGPQLTPWMVSEPPVTDVMHMSMGVEKNPWYMAYVGVKAETQPRQIFFPFGPAISMKARAFAKPFGGRVGPWYAISWPRAASESAGNRTDILLPPRTKQNGLMDSPTDITRLPNYSRFPGDTLGLKSKLALNSMTQLPNLRVGYNEFFGTYTLGGGAADPLAWDYQTNSASAVRNYELTIAAPDLFDVTYYSVEPNAAINYYTRMRDNRNVLPFPGQTRLRPDLGWRPGVGSLDFYSVQNQMAAAASFGKRQFEAFWFVTQKEHLLTSWAPAEGAMNYAFPPNFGKCATPDDNLSVKVPGSCAAGGGRTGYSVKLISRHALFSDAHTIGGAGEPPGAILNPPAGPGW
ncbi:MAG: Tad domain-containing protein [Bdellovibrionales bacterium]|nr:Tad domain-containing protein [Bdellovibrionales bacterium]